MPILSFPSGVLQQRPAERVGGVGAPRPLRVARGAQPPPRHPLPVPGAGGELARARPPLPGQQGHQDARSAHNYFSPRTINSKCITLNVDL